MNEKNSTAIEREAERSREHVASLLDELRTRITPGGVVDQVYEYTRDNAVGDFVRTLGTQVRNNPLACTLIGAGVGWLMVSDRKPQNKTASYAADGGMAGDTAERAKELGTEAAESARRGWRSTTDAGKRAYGMASEGTSSMAEAASNAASKTADTVSSAASKTAETVSDGFESARRGAHDLADAGRSAASRMAQRSSDAVDYMKEQPLVLVAMGLAIGAAIGASFPSTETEDRLMGEASDEAKDTARRMGEEQFERTKEVAADSAERMMGDAEEITREVTEDVGIVPSSGEEGHGESSEQREAMAEGVSPGGEHQSGRRS